MKKILITAIITMIATHVYGIESGAQCPDGYTQITQPDIILTTNTCPANYTDYGTAQSCADTTPDAVCFMYLPTQTTFDDATGTYEYTEICVMDESI